MRDSDKGIGVYGAERFHLAFTGPSEFQLL
jgi:hypothetical protein